MGDSFAKKALQQKKAKKKQDKRELREERKANKAKEKNPDEMIAYIDEFGNLSDSPPDMQNRQKIKAEDIQLGAAAIEEQKEHTGVVTSFFTDKAFGFITEDNTKASVFVHSNQMLEPINENDKVVFEKERTPKGFAAVNVRKIK